MPCFIYSSKYIIDLGDHAFQTQKFALTAEKFFGKGDFIEPELPSRDDLLLAHTQEWVDKVLNSKMTEQDEALMELPFSKEISTAHQLSASGTILACRKALEMGVGLHIGGGSHHAFADHGEGFCVLNDLACGILKMRQEKNIRRAAVIDLDVHQGNGSASIFSNDPDIFTFSMHQRDIYPEVKAKSSLDIEVPTGSGDDFYLNLLRQNLPKVFEHDPELIVYQAGVDSSAEDLLGGLKLSHAGLLKRDQIVFEACRSRKIPVAVTLGGGYSSSPAKTAILHFQTLAIFASFTA